MKFGLGEDIWWKNSVAKGQQNSVQSKQCLVFHLLCIAFQFHIQI